MSAHGFRPARIPTMGSPVGADSKQSEKEYLRRTSGGAWERLKPFSPPGTSTLGDSAALIQDFAAALRHLPPSPDDLILDLGAGACWCSDWLQRLNLRTVAVDISVDMLSLGRTRLTGPRPWVVAGDLEQLPVCRGHIRQGVLPQRHSSHPRHPERAGRVEPRVDAGRRRALLRARCGARRQGRVGDRDARLRRARTGHRRVGVHGRLHASRLCTRDAAADVVSHPAGRAHRIAVGGVDAAGGVQAAGSRGAHNLARRARTAGPGEARRPGRRDARRCSWCGCCAAPWPIIRSSSRPSASGSRSSPAGAARRDSDSRRPVTRHGGPAAYRAVAHSQHRERRRGRPTGRRRHRRFGWAFSCSPPTSGCSIGISTGMNSPGRSRRGKAIDVDLTCPVPERVGRTTSSSTWSKKAVTWFEPQGSAIARHAVEITERA